jgi:hypothetical protein
LQNKFNYLNNVTEDAAEEADDFEQQQQTK